MRTPDFKRVVEDLLVEHRVSEEGLASMMRDRYGFSVSQSTIHRIRRGHAKAPRYQHAAALLEMHAELQASDAAA